MRSTLRLLGVVPAAVPGAIGAQSPLAVPKARRWQPAHAAGPTRRSETAQLEFADHAPAPPAQGPPDRPGPALTFRVQCKHSARKPRVAAVIEDPHPGFATSLLLLAATTRLQLQSKPGGFGSHSYQAFSEMHCRC